MVLRLPPAVPPLLPPLPPFLAGWCHGKREYFLSLVLDCLTVCQCQVKAERPTEHSLAAVMWPLWPTKMQIAGVAMKPLSCHDKDVGSDNRTFPTVSSSNFPAHIQIETGMEAISLLLVKACQVVYCRDRTKHLLSWHPQYEAIIQHSDGLWWSNFKCSLKCILFLSPLRPSATRLTYCKLLLLLQISGNSKPQ